MENPGGRGANKDSVVQALGDCSPVLADARSGGRNIQLMNPDNCSVVEAENFTFEWQTGGVACETLHPDEVVVSLTILPSSTYRSS